MPAADTIVGATLADYQILRKLGDGGVGAVYLAVDLMFGRRAALKLPRPELLESAEAQERFLRDARVAATINRPGIVAIYGAGVADRRPFLAMECVDGPTLGQTIAAGKPPVARVLDWAAQIAAELDEIHRHGLVYASLRPSNVVLTESGRLKLLDFGLAGAIPRGEAALAALARDGGRLQHLPPELLRGERDDARTDLYCFGVLLYELSTGRSPFHGMKGKILVDAILKGEAPPIADQPGLTQVIRRAMDPRPQKRFASAIEMRDALHRPAEAPRVPARAPVAPPVPVVAPAPPAAPPVPKRPPLEANVMLAAIPAAPQPLVKGPLLGVLAFENLSRDRSMDWLGAGIAETLTSWLRVLKPVRTISQERVEAAVRQSTRGGELNVEEAGHRMGARWLLTGNYQRSGNQLRIMPCLLEVGTGAVVASAKLDGPWSDVFALEGRAISEMLAAIEFPLDENDRRRIAAPETSRLEAYEQYVQGRKRLREATRPSLAEAREHFERAVELDDGYAQALAALGATYATQAASHGGGEDLAAGLACLERALELDPDLAEPYQYLCYIHSRQGQPALALQAGKICIERQPDSFHAHYFLSVAYTTAQESGLGFYSQQAIDCALAAARIEPRHQASWISLAVQAIDAGCYDVAETYLDRPEELATRDVKLMPFPAADLLRGAIWMRRRDWAHAREWCVRSKERLTAPDQVSREALLALTACGLADVHLRENNADAALACYRNAWHIAQQPEILGQLRLLARAAAGIAAASAAEGHRKTAEESFGQAVELADRARLEPQAWIPEASSHHLYHALAVAARRLGRTDLALNLLEHSVERGWRDPDWLASDPELASLRSQPRWQPLLEKARQNPPLRFG